MTPKSYKSTGGYPSPNPEEMQQLQSSLKPPDQMLWRFILKLAHVQFALSMYFRVMCTARPQDDPYLRPWKVAKDATYLFFLVGMYLEYYFMDVYLQIAALPALYVRV
jgi:hypothetical protein